MLHLNFAQFPELNTKRLRLRSLNKSDAKAILRLRSDEKVNQFLDRPPNINLGEALTFIEKIQSGVQESKWIYWAISLKPNDELIGTICFWNIIRERNRAETGYELLPEYQGLGIMQEAFKIVLEFGLRTLKLKTIVARTHPGNKKSIRLLEKNEFLPDTLGTFICEEDAQGEAPYYLYLPF